MEYEIYHHGVKGQKWGVRRYQKKDGSLTRLGKKRLQSDEESTKEQAKAQKKAAKEQAKAQKKAAQEAEQKRKAADAEKKKQEQEEANKKQAEEAREQLRSRLLKSNNAQELYENRHLLPAFVIRGLSQCHLRGHELWQTRCMQPRLRQSLYC